MKVKTLHDDVLMLGYRPQRGLILGMLRALADAGITDVEPIPLGVMMLVNRGRVDLDEAMEAHAAGKKWCAWHGKYEDPATFRDLGRGDCSEGETERDRLRRLG